MQRMGRMHSQGPAATVVVTLEGTDGTKIQMGGEGETGVGDRVTELWGKVDFEVVFKNLDLIKFSFAHEHASMKPCNMSRWMDGLNLGMEVMRPGEEVVRDPLEIKNMEVVGVTGMSARLVVIPLLVGRAALFLYMAPI